MRPLLTGGEAPGVAAAKNAVFAAATTGDCLAGLPKVRDPPDEIAAALGATLDLALAGETREVLPLALADGMPVFDARSRKE